jgi:hypothetical protein
LIAFLSLKHLRLFCGSYLCNFLSSSYASRNKVRVSVAILFSFTKYLYFTPCSVLCQAWPQHLIIIYKYITQQYCKATERGLARNCREIQRWLVYIHFVDNRKTTCTVSLLNNNILYKNVFITIKCRKKSEAF